MKISFQWRPNLKQLRYESGKTTLLDIIKKHAAHKLVDFLLLQRFAYTPAHVKRVYDDEETQYFCEEYFAV